MNQIKLITVEDVRDSGVLQEVNRQFLHPLGLALAVEMDPDAPAATARFTMWDYRDDPEGVLFTWEGLTDAQGKAAATAALHASKLAARHAIGCEATGIQPLPTPGTAQP